MPWLSWWSSPVDAKTKRNRDILGEAQETLGEAIKPIVPKTGAPQPAHSALQPFTQPETLVATAILTAAALGTFRFYKAYLRRIPEATNIHPSFFRQRSIFGKVTSVGDGDNFRLYHTPGGRLTGWGWLPGRRIPTEKKELRNQTIHVRLAGIDAPELSHFGRPAQPYSEDALQWLTKYVLGRRVRAYVYKADQYSRVVGTVYVRKGILRRDVGLQMIRAGFATVYEAKTGAEFGEGLEQKYHDAEKHAKSKKKGMWAGDPAKFESPREYKSKYGTGTT